MSTMLMRPLLSSLIKRIARGIPITSPWAAAFWWRPLAPPGRASLRHTWFTVQKKAGSLRGLCLYCRDGFPPSLGSSCQQMTCLGSPLSRPTLNAPDEWRLKAECKGCETQFTLPLACEQGGKRDALTLGRALGWCKGEANGAPLRPAHSDDNLYSKSQPSGSLPVSCSLFTVTL